MFQLKAANQYPSVVTKEDKDYLYHPAINAVQFVLINHATELTQRIILVYRKHSSNISQYENGIRDILNDYGIIIILSDITIDYLNHDDIKPLKTLMLSLKYTQLVKSPTFVLLELF